jgi:CBS domain-containing protein
MKVQDVMTKDVIFCAPQDNLADAADLLIQRDCGVLPIVDAAKKVVGIITDRDICIAAASRNMKPSDIKTADFTGKKVFSCQANEKIEDVLKKMKKYQIKRLPVTSQDDALVGIISIADILSATDEHKSLRKKVISTLKSISKPRPILLREI